MVRLWGGVGDHDGPRVCLYQHIPDRPGCHPCICLSDTLWPGPSAVCPVLGAPCRILFPPETSTVSPPRSQGIASQRASSKTRLEAPIPNPATSPTVLPSHRALLAHLGWPQRTHEMIPNSCQLMEPLAALETGPRLQNRLARSVN